MRFDEIEFEEERLCLESQIARLQVAATGARALEWFRRYTKGEHIKEVLIPDVRLVASATPDAGIAAVYIKRATTHYLADILGLACQYAHEDMNSAKQAGS